MGSASATGNEPGFGAGGAAILKMADPVALVLIWAAVPKVPSPLPA